MGRGWIVAAMASLGCIAAAQDTSIEQVHATLWMQTAPEYRAATEQVYRLATEKIANPQPGTAALEQVDVPADKLMRLPTAVILDIDETALSNWPAYKLNNYSRILHGPCDLHDGPCGIFAYQAMGISPAIEPTRDLVRAAKRLADMLFEGAEAPEGVEEAIRARMSGRLHHVGSSADTAPVIEGSFAQLIGILEAHLARRPYLFGARPCLADFGLAAQLGQLH